MVWYLYRHLQREIDLGNINISIRTLQIDVQRVTRSERLIIINLYPLFIHDNWAYSDTLPNPYGIIGSALRADGQPATTLAEESEMLTPYWQEDAGHEALLIHVDRNPAGFCLLQHGVADPANCDHFIDEFFVAHPYRRLGVGLHVVREVCSRNSGKWCVSMKARNQPAIDFWRRAVASVSDEVAQEETLIGDFGPFIMMCFRVEGR